MQPKGKRRRKMYAVLKNSTAQLLQATKTNTTTKIYWHNKKPKTKSTLIGCDIIVN